MNLKFKILSLLTLTGFLCSAQDVRESKLENFNAISASGAVSVKYIVSDTTKIVLKGNESDFDNIEYKLEGKTLHIKSKGNISNPLKIEVSGNGLTEITTSGASSVKSNNKITADKFKIDATGASNINLTLEIKKLDLVASGASDINLKGNAQVADETVTGAASLKSYEFIVDTLNILTSGASTAKVYGNKKLSINATGASTVKFKGEPTEVSAEGGSASKIMKIGTDDSSASKNPSDTTKNKTSFKYKNKEIIIIDNDDKNNVTIQHSDLTRKHWQGLWFGFAGYTNAQQGFTMSNPNKYMELDYGRSFNFQWNLGQQNFNLYKKYIQLSTGVGFQFNNLSFENKTRLNADSSFTHGLIDSSNVYGYDKNRFKQTYVTVPLLLNFNTSSKLKKNVHFTCGVVGKYLLTSKSKQVLTLNGDQYTFRRKDGYNLNPFQFDAYASVGYRNFTIYAQYALTEMFKANKGPQVYPFSAGIRLLSFD